MHSKELGIVWCLWIMAWRIETLCYAGIPFTPDWIRLTLESKAVYARNSRAITYSKSVRSYGIQMDSVF